jgi:hypothetical protein
MGAADSCETLITVYQTTRRHITQYSNLLTELYVKKYDFVFSYISGVTYARLWTCNLRLNYVAECNLIFLSVLPLKWVWQNISGLTGAEPLSGLCWSKPCLTRLLRSAHASVVLSGNGFCYIIHWIKFVSQFIETTNKFSITTRYLVSHSLYFSQEVPASFKF